MEGHKGGGSYIGGGSRLSRKRGIDPKKGGGDQIK